MESLDPRHLLSECALSSECPSSCGPRTSMERVALGLLIAIKMGQFHHHLPDPLSVQFIGDLGGLCLFLSQEPWTKGALELPSDPRDWLPSQLPGLPKACPRHWLLPGGQTGKDSFLRTGNVSVILAGL